MSLRSQLLELLPEVLPENPAVAMKGTELIHVLRLHLDGNYSDASLRYHFSVMSVDPASPIAKVEKGQGYYRRTPRVPALSGAQELVSMSQGRLDGLEGEDTGDRVDRALERVRKFRAIIRRFHEINGLFPFEYRAELAAHAPLGNLWKFPEMVLVDWQTGLDPEEATQLDPKMLALKQHLGLPPFRITSVRLRIQPSLDGYREDFFQTLSASQWTQGAELIYALPIHDGALADGLRELNAVHGVGVCSFGLSAEALDELPRAEHILNARPSETDALMERIQFDRIAAPRRRPHIDWDRFEAMRRESQETAELMNWLGSCLHRGRAEPWNPHFSR